MTNLAGIACLIWAVLLFARGRFWQMGPTLAPARPSAAVPVAIVVPARNEADVIGASLGSLLAQDYPSFRVILVDDASTDATAAIARGFSDSRLVICSARPRPAGWSGKLWAVAEGVEQTQEELLLLTDADIVHDPLHLATLVAKAESEDLDLVSEMVELSCETFPERALIPAFVYFFQLLYPFAWVNDPLSQTAAAAGGTMLIRRRALERIGGIAAIRNALIDDVALARMVKRGGRIWLGHSTLARSIRRYGTFGEIWRMIARTAFVQLRHSWTLLLLTLLGMALVWIIPPLAALFGHGLARLLGFIAWAGAAWSYWPSLKRFRLSPLWAPALPLIALFYMAATFGSAVEHARGRGALWKGRTYSKQHA
jgi:hopene-associated glycosyltransferase HpnB